MLTRFFGRPAAPSATDRRKHPIREADKFAATYDAKLPFFMQK